jgi:hypothetical protein
MNNPLRNLPKEKLQQFILICILTLIAVVAIVFFWIDDLKIQWAKSKDKIAKLAPQIEDAERKEKAEAQNLELRRRLTAFVELQRTSMVTGDLFSWALREISLFAEHHSVKSAGLHPGLRAPYPRESGYETYFVTAELQGEFDDIGRFLCDFENKFPTAQVRAVNMTSGDGKTTGRMATVELAFLIWPDSATSWVAPKPKAMKITLLCLLSAALALAVGAAPKPVPAAASTVYPMVPVLSVYQPKNTRDPFICPGQEAMHTSSVPGTPAPKVSASAFRLQAIFYDARNPSALVNNQELFLNKTATVKTSSGLFHVKPVDIQPARVLLEVEGQRVELMIEDSRSTAPEKPKTKE